jgi:mRNA interferase RelE/StbE
LTTSKKKSVPGKQRTSSPASSAKVAAPTPRSGRAPNRQTTNAAPAKAAKPSTHKYKLKFHPEALDEWHALDNSVRAPLKKLLKKRLDNPRVPGGELHPPLAGCYKIKMKRAGIRLVYEVEDDALVVYVLAVDKREDSAVYAAASSRVTSLTAEIIAAAKKPK